MTVGMHHVALRVSDLDRSVRFYRDTLGLEELERRTLPGVEIAFLGYPGTRNTSLELIAGRDDHHHGDGLVHHVAFTVPDVQAAFDRLRLQNVTLLSDAPQAVWEGKLVVFFRGPDGERLEVCGA